MKGGVTSGIVYPAAVRVLADHFRFVNIGGTSAGAIAASLTAAAEYRRWNGGGMAGFERLARVPIELSERGALFGLFRPNPRTRKLFDQILRLTKSGSVGAALLTALRDTFRGPKHWIARFGSGLGIAAGTAFVAVFRDWDALVGAVSIALLGVIGGAGIALWRSAVEAQRVFVENGYGLSSGVDEDAPDDGTVLGVWLGRLLDDVAGLPEGEHLTFGHLWNGRPPLPSDGPHRPTEPGPVINLEMVSTCLSHGRPYTFPTGTDVFYFRPEIMRRYLHRDIVDAMVGAARSAGHVDRESELGAYVRMPFDRDLPVVLAARMSLAFPALLSAVELGARAFAEVRRKGDEAHTEVGNAPLSSPKATGAELLDMTVESMKAGTSEPVHAFPEPCWFADGGLSSNFPIHLFDAPLPRWPTIGINLGTFSNEEEASYKNTDDQGRYVWMPNQNSAGLQETWSRFSNIRDYFGGAMVGAIKDWNDNVQMKVPGFRDRIATVKLRKSEGGLNLDMGLEKIRPLVARGRAAGEMLAKRFAQPSTGSFSQPMDWDNHRWVRVRVLTSTGQAYLRDLARGYAGRQPGDCTYDELLRGSEARRTGPYHWRSAGETAARARHLMRSAGAYARWLRRYGVDFTDGAPSPLPRLMKRPQY